MPKKLFKITYWKKIKVEKEFEDTTDTDPEDGEPIVVTAEDWAKDWAFTMSDNETYAVKEGDTVVCDKKEDIVEAALAGVQIEKRKHINKLIHKLVEAERVMRLACPPHSGLAMVLWVFGIYQGKRLTKEEVYKIQDTANEIAEALDNEKDIAV